MTNEDSPADALPDKQPQPNRKRPNTKRTGELAEAAFLLKAESLGLRVSKPWGDSERYDFLLDSSGRLCRVQVKCTQSASGIRAATSKGILHRFRLLHPAVPTALCLDYEGGGRVD